MSGQLARLQSLPSDTRPERRKVSRYPTEVTALLRAASGDQAEVRIADVSTHGCSVRGEAAWLRVGIFLSIGFDEEPGLQAVVRWIRDGSAGMEFLRPVPPESKEWHALINSPFGA